MAIKSRLPSMLLLPLAALPLIAQTGNPSTVTAFTGTWFGSFNVRTPNGSPKRDTAVLVLTADGKAVTGTMGASIEQQLPISGVQLMGDEIRFHMEAPGGLDFKLRREADHLVGAVSGKMQATVDVRPAPGLLPHDRLVGEISQADRKLFEAFDTCKVEALRRLPQPRFGVLSRPRRQNRVSGATRFASATMHGCTEGLVLRRELVQNSLIVNAAPGLAGTHRFYAKQKDGSERVDATARFTEIWTKVSGSWKLVRVISYDHQHDKPDQVKP